MSELEDAEVTFPYKCVKNTPTSGTVLTENWRLAEILLHNQAVRKFHPEQVRKEREAMSLSPVF